MDTFPSTVVTELTRKDPVLNTDTHYAEIPCCLCMARGELDRFKQIRRGTKSVKIADFAAFPVCDLHAEEFVGDKR